MANVPISNMTATWTDSGTTYNAIKMNVIDTASNANSLLMDLQVGGSTRLSITKAGLIQGTGGYYVGLGGGLQSWFSNINAVGTVGFGPAFTSDTILVRDAANTLAQRNATNAQTFRLYNTFTDASNYERGSIGWSANVLTIAAENAGTGANRGITLLGRGETIVESVLSQITFRTASASRWGIYTNGMLGTIVDNALDIGASGSNRPRYLYLGGGSLTGTAADSSVTISPTWNTTGTPTAILLNVTDTASNASSLLMDLGTGGGTFASKFKVDKTGRVSSGYGYTYAKPQFYDHSIGDGAGFQVVSSAGCAFYGSNTALAGIDSTPANGLRISSNLALGWTNSHALAASPDTTLYRDAADTLALRRATNVQTFRVYNTFTDASNGAWTEISGNLYGANQRGIVAKANGTGTGVNPDFFIGSDVSTGALYIRAAATTVWRFTVNGHFFAQTDNTYDIGASGANRPRTIYVGSNIVLPAGGGSSVQWEGRSRIYGGSTDGVIALSNAAFTDFGRIQFGGTTSAFPALKRVGANLQTVAADDTATAGLIVGNQALATTATDGFLYVPSCAGTPTGVPTARTGTVPIVVDTTNNKLYFYSGAAWRDAGP